MQKHFQAFCCSFMICIKIGDENVNDSRFLLFLLKRVEFQLQTHGWPQTQHFNISCIKLFLGTWNLSAKQHEYFSWFFLEKFLQSRNKNKETKRFLSFSNISMIKDGLFMLSLVSRSSFVFFVYKLRKAFEMWLAHCSRFDLSVYL